MNRDQLFEYLGRLTMDHTDGGMGLLRRAGLTPCPLPEEMILST